MANFGGMSVQCDAADVTMRYVVEETIKRDPDSDVVRARILKIGAPRWNSSSGRKPTQAEADAMVEGPLEFDGEPAKPSIYRPVTLKVEKVYSGTTRLGETLVAYAESGRIGQDWVTSCAFGSADRLLIHHGGQYVATVGESYLMFLENRLIGSTIGDLFVVQGPLVVGPTGRLEPLP
jgi:hypothetical protein